MGTFFHALEPVNGFQLRLMNGMGYDATDVAPFIKPAKITDPLKTAKKLQPN